MPTQAAARVQEHFSNGVRENWYHHWRWPWPRCISDGCENWYYFIGWIKREGSHIVLLWGFTCWNHMPQRQRWGFWTDHKRWAHSWTKCHSNKWSNLVLGSKQWDILYIWYFNHCARTPQFTEEPESNAVHGWRLGFLCDGVGKGVHVRTPLLLVQALLEWVLGFDQRWRPL